MALSDADLVKLQKMTFKTVIDALEQVVFPKFDELSSGVHKEISEVKTRLGGLEEKVGSLDDRLGSVEERLGSVEEKINHTNRKMDVLVDEFQDHDKRITKLEIKAGFAVG